MSPLELDAHTPETNAEVSRGDIDDSSVIISSAIGHGCTIGSSTVVSSSAVLEGAKIGSNCHIEGCLIGRNAVIGDNVRMANQVVAFNQRNDA